MRLPRSSRPTAGARNPSRSKCTSRSRSVPAAEAAGRRHPNSRRSRKGRSPVSTKYLPAGRAAGETAVGRIAAGGRLPKRKTARKRSLPGNKKQKRPPQQGTLRKENALPAGAIAVGVGMDVPTTTTARRAMLPARRILRLFSSRPGPRKMPPPAHLGRKVRRRKAKELRRETARLLRPVSDEGTTAAGGAATPAGMEATVRNVLRTRYRPRMFRLGIVLRSARPKDRGVLPEPQDRHPANVRREAARQNLHLKVGMADGDVVGTVVGAAIAVRVARQPVEKTTLQGARRNK